MIEGSRDRRLYGIGNYDRLDVPPLRATGGTRRLSQGPVSAFSSISELDFVSDDEPTANGKKNTEPQLSPCSQISKIDFASREDITPIPTPIDTEPEYRVSFLSFGTSDDSSSIGTNDELDQLAASEESLKGVGKRPLPELPGQAQSRPLPARPTIVVPDGRFSRSLSPEFIQGCSKDTSTASRPSSDPGSDTRGRSSVGENRQTHDRTPEDTTPVHAPEDSPLLHHTPVTPPRVSFASDSSPPPPPSPPYPSLESLIPVPKTPKPHHIRDLASPTSIDLIAAASLPIAGENGEQILFGALFRDRKVVVIFIRYFWCLFCDDYVRSISKSVTPEIMKNKGVDLVVIGNGSPDMIKMYKSTPLFTFEVRIFDETDIIGFRDAKGPIQGVYRPVFSAARRSRVIQNQRSASPVSTRAGWRKRVSQE